MEEWCRWGAQEAAGGERDSGQLMQWVGERRGGSLEKGGDGGGWGWGGGVQLSRAVPSRNADCFHVWEGQKGLSWLQAGVVSP